MPGQKSLAAQQYYAHPQNLFWRFMGEQFGAAMDLPYAKRKSLLCDNGVAVWDVLKACIRPGSLDSAIRMDSVEANDFRALFEQYPGISKVYFNGRAASTLYHKKVLVNLPAKFDYIRYCCLPSTSPANASIPLPEKRRAWLCLSQEVVANSTAVGANHP